MFCLLGLQRLILYMPPTSPHVRPQLQTQHVDVLEVTLNRFRHLHGN
jgi:hypothetical protein